MKRLSFFDKMHVYSGPEFEKDLEQGVKHDEGKLDHTYISVDLLDELAKLRAAGAKKYGRDNWKKGFKFNRSLAAFRRGEDVDAETGSPHIVCAIANLEHLLHDYLYRKDVNDDRSTR